MFDSFLCHANEGRVFIAFRPFDFLIYHRHIDNVQMAMEYITPRLFRQSAVVLACAQPPNEQRDRYGYYNRREYCTG